MLNITPKPDRYTITLFKNGAWDTKSNLTYPTMSSYSEAKKRKGWKTVSVTKD